MSKILVLIKIVLSLSGKTKTRTLKTYKIMEKELFKIFWQNVKSTYPEGTSKHTNAILEEDFEKVWSEIIALISSRKT